MHIYIVSQRAAVLQKPLDFIFFKLLTLDIEYSVFYFICKQAVIMM